jgi:acetolactate synthase regulatory subunit
MARKVVLVSDLTGAEADESEFISLVVRQHPEVDSARSLDVLPSEVEKLKTVDNLVVCEIKDNGNSREVVMTLTEFRKVCSDDVVKKAAGTRGRKLGSTIGKS